VVFAVFVVVCCCLFLGSLVLKRLLDLLWLVLLGAFVFAIPPTFHGDELMQIYMSHDYATLFIDHNPTALLTSPPYGPDTDQQLRLINGSVNRYAIGLSWQIAGLTTNDLPPHPGWDWGLDYDTNVSTGHVPAPALMAAGRFSSTLFLALSVAVMFGLGWQIGKPHASRPLAYFVSGLYALNPVVLLNGRRALQEGSTLFFGLLMILIAVLISRRRSESKPMPIYLWIGLILAGGLTLASKYTGIVFVVGAFGWIFFAEFVHIRWRDLLLTAGKLIACGILSLLLFIALSPALWIDPPVRLIDSLQARAELLNIQVVSYPDAPMTLAQRIQAIIVQPFMTTPEQFEVAFWANFKAVTDDVTRYMSSPFSGLQFGVILGGALTLLVGVGLIFTFRRDWRVGLLAWVLITIASLLANPLPWQRYYLGLIPLATLLVGIGIEGLVRRFVRKPEQGLKSQTTPTPLE
jgi:Dolichyl-phosphate-mannose-protein mannosyltransferase